MEDKIRAENLSVSFGDIAVLRSVTLSLRHNEILSVIGPAGGGKTTFLRSLNRLNDLHTNVRRRGKVLLDSQDLYGPEVDVADLRRRVGMVYAVPVTLPGTIYENLTFGPRVKGIRDRDRLLQLAEDSLRSAVLWDEVRGRLDEPALRLSGGQQQRLCIARALALAPEVLLLDEPCSGLDPISTAKIEEALQELKRRYSIILVTNNIKQAARCSDRTAFFLMGEMVECDVTELMFTNPRDKRASDYVTGRFG